MGVAAALSGDSLIGPQRSAGSPISKLKVHAMWEVVNHLCM